MIKIRVTEEGKEFEAYLKYAIIENNILLGISYAAGFTAARAVHAALYNKNPIEIVYENGRVRSVNSSQSFRRIETVDDLITHHTLLPRSTSDEDYQELLIDMVKYDKKEYPPRIVVAPKGNAVEVAGHFIAETFGLPKKSDWVNKYVMLLTEKCQKLEVISTDLAGNWKGLKAFKIQSMSEEYVLNSINEAIKNGTLITRSQSIYGDGIFAEDMTTEDYLRANVEIIAKKLDATMKPLYDGSKIDSCVGEIKRLPVPTQAKASVASLEVLKQKKGVFVVGDMGTGKTQISLTSVYMYHKRRVESGSKEGTRVLIVAPANVIPKWATLEIPKILPFGTYRTRIIKTTEDALRYVNEIKQGKKVAKRLIEVVLVSTDRMKLTAQGFVLGAKWDTRYLAWRSPNTGELLKKPNATKKELADSDSAVAGWSDVVDRPKLPPTTQEITEAKKKGILLSNGLPKGYVKTWKPTIRNFQDNYDGKVNRSLARPAKKEWAETKGNARWMIAEIFQRHLKNNFHLAIFDEVHQMKASGSGRGLALHKIMKAARKHIYLTGTLTNGQSTSIKSLLWRAFAGEMIAQGITYETSDEQFAQRYGVVEKIKTLDDGNTIRGTHTKQKKDNIIIKEKPGISPKLISDFLLDKCIFIELSDLGIPLVKLEEIPKVIQLDDDHYDEYKKFHRNHYDTAFTYQRELGSAAWSNFNPSTINYADQPQLGANVKFERYDKDGNYELLDEIVAPKFPDDYINAKERELLKDIRDEIKQNRRCIIFTHYSGGYNTNERLKKLIEQKGFTCEIMNERVSTDERVDWLEQHNKKGTDVLIMNQRLVEVGLDLMETPTIMFYQLNDDINVVRQASRRSFRLGQHRVSKVIYYIADKTTQMIQFQRLMSRRVAAMIVEGRIERSNELAKYADTSTNGAVSDLSKTLSSVELTNAWVSAAEKDIDADLELITEEEFQSKVGEAFARLTNETLQLCGYQKQEDSISLDFDMEALDKAYEELLALEKAYNSLTLKSQENKVTKNDENSVIQFAEFKMKKDVVIESEKVEYEQLDLFSDFA